MTRNGMPRASQLVKGGDGRRQRLVAHDEHAVEIEEQAADAARAPAGVKSARRHGRHPGVRRARAWPVAVAPCRLAHADTWHATTSQDLAAAPPRRRPRMGLLDGKKALIFGVANDHSIAWGIAQAFHAQGASVGFSSVESLIEKRVRPLAERLGVDVRGTVRRPGRRADRPRLRGVGDAARATSTSSCTRSRSRSARNSTGSSSRRARGRLPPRAGRQRVLARGPGRARHGR